MRIHSPGLLIVLFAVSIVTAGSPAGAVDGQIVITHAKAMAGNVTPGDAAGYPVKLSMSGSYILGSELSPGPGLDAIVAASSDIALDLNGFKISGGPAGGTNNGRHGIVVQGDRLTVKNGTITGFEGSAIHAPNRSYLVVEHMRLINSMRGAFNSGGTLTRIKNSMVAANVNVGIMCGSSCHVEGNVVANNGDHGIVILSSGAVLGNTIVSNAALGILGLGVVGFGNNALINNNGGGDQVAGSGPVQLHPNVCVPVAC